MNRRHAASLLPAMAVGTALRGAESSEAAHNVKTFGAKGDGRADDTRAIQTALDRAGERGGTERNFFVGPKYWVLNGSLLKRIPLNDRFRLEVRGDATNFTNSVSFGAPTADITSSIFGRIRDTTTSSSRKVQIAAKLHF